MIRFRSLAWPRVAGALLPVLLTPRLLACAVCFGKSDSPLAEAMNMGILSLLVVVVCVLGACAGFFVHLARRAARFANAADAAESGSEPSGA